jgi:ribosomal RNA-processing protein 1
MIDVLRMEKFLLVVRRYIGSTFNVLKAGGWEKRRVEEVLGMMEETVLNVESMKIPMGLRFHVIDIWVDELEKVGVLEDTEEDRKVQDMMMAPILKLREGSPTKTMRTKARDALNDERIPGNERPEVVEEDTEGEWGGFKD